jgi:hypothetical protein
MMPRGLCHSEWWPWIAAPQPHSIIASQAPMRNLSTAGTRTSAAAAVHRTGWLCGGGGPRLSHFSPPSHRVPPVPQMTSGQRCRTQPLQSQLRLDYRIQVPHQSDHSAHKLNDPLHGHTLLGVERRLHTQELSLREERRQWIVELMLDERREPLQIGLVRRPLRRGRTAW